MVERRLIEVDGVVQGVGFRPYIHRLAAAHDLRGFVRNSTLGVLIDVQGEAGHVDEFCRLLPLEPPALACITQLRVEPVKPRACTEFRIAPSTDRSQARSTAVVPPDAATCDACVSELFDPASRRFEHAFITCTDCGPRFTIVLDTPYDRERTTMRDFPLCADCQSEYEDPANRRFHAEAIACPNCGPSLVAFGGAEPAVRTHGRDALNAALATLRSGEVVAIKALGGFHLACDATNDVAVARLRERKHRPAKPFAVMVRDAEAASALCVITSVERALLESPARPVVLLTRNAHAAISPRIAPRNDTLGVMLPSTPLHHLLIEGVGRPLVMTSGNRSGEPVATDDVQAIEGLSDIADLVLTHDRAIAARCDDSVMRVVAGNSVSLRRARGHVPRAIPLPFEVPEAVLAMGGHLKNTVCMAHRRSAHLSPHVGDLDAATAREAMLVAVRDVVRGAGARPVVIAHDLHADYASTRAVESLATEYGVDRRVPVQHHHAHVAACLAEHHVSEPVIGVVFDGAGLGSDGAIWGGEFLAVDGARFTRCGHLAYVPLPGGDAAARRPWRSALSHLQRAGFDEGRMTAMRPSSISDLDWSRTLHVVQRETRSPLTSSVGRLFDAVASLLGVCHEASFEGEAAMALEWTAGARIATRYSVPLSGGAVWTASAAPLIDAIVTDVSSSVDGSEIAAGFHGAMRDLVVMGCERIREDVGLETVVLSGGVFMNRLLSESAHDALVARRFRVLLPRRAPCNDGGLSLGQVYVAACALREDSCA